MRVRLRQVLLQETDLLELFLGALSLSWGIHVLNPALSSFHLPQYQEMAALATEGVWAGIFIVLGIGRIIAVLKSGSEVYFRKYQAFIGALVWMFLAIMFFRADPRSPSSIVYATIATASIGVYLRLPEGRAPWRYFKPPQD